MILRLWLLCKNKFNICQSFHWDSKRKMTNFMYGKCEIHANASNQIFVALFLIYLEKMFSCYDLHTNIVKLKPMDIIQICHKGMHYLKAPNDIWTNILHIKFKYYELCQPHILYYLPDLFLFFSTRPSKMGYIVQNWLT